MEEATTTPLRELIDTHMRSGGHGPLDELVAKRRGVGRSWGRIATEIWELSGRSVNRFTLWEWYPEHRERP